MAAKYDPVRRRDRKGRFKSSKHIGKTTDQMVKDVNNNVTSDYISNEHSYCTKRPEPQLMAPDTVPIFCDDTSHDYSLSLRNRIVENISLDHPGRVGNRDINSEDVNYDGQDPKWLPKTFNNSCDNRTIDWREGRRVVELSFLADGLQNGCSFCHSPLQLWDCFSEKHYGLGSMLLIKCWYCETVNYIPTGKRHKTGQHKERSTWDVNTKLAAAMVHSGLGLKTVNTILTALNIPGVSETTLKSREREVGKSLESVAKTSCDEYVKKEVDLSENNKIEVSYDAGWQKRGSGRSYSSLSAHGCMIGAKTGKVISYAVRNKDCRFCSNAAKHGQKVKPHDCRKNWSGSAKGMECDMAVNMLKSLQSQDIEVETLTMDDDTTTIARARKEINPQLKKKSDANHAKKHLSNKLYGLQVAKKYRKLGNKTISHIKKCFNNAIAMNRKNPHGLKRNLISLTPHLFGDHSGCGENCGFVRDPENYIPKNLPYNKYLEGNDLKNDLQETLTSFGEQADKLSDLGSSQANESFHNTVASKAPKRIHYSSSESTSFRVAAATSQKNLGCQ